MPVELKDLTVGCSVHYQPEHYGPNKFENGVVKEIRPDIQDSVWVVYNCNYEWHRYQDYTSAKTNLRDLNLGWRHNE